MQTLIALAILLTYVIVMPLVLSGRFKKRQNL
jgi:hypothetical protein